MKMAEIRLSRSYFESLLERVCDSLDKKSNITMVWCDPYFKTSHKCNVAVNRVWVVGPFAKGNLNCLFLEMVAEILTEGCRGYSSILPARLINRTLFQSYPRLRLYTGIPSSNTSGTPFLKAAQVWGEEIANSSSAIRQIVTRSINASV